MTRTYEKLLYSRTLMHFNPNHDPRNGQFSEGHDGFSTKTGKMNNKSKNTINKGDAINGVHLSESQKKALKIGAVAAITSIAIIGGIALSKSGKLDNVIDLGKKSN